LLIRATYRRPVLDRAPEIEQLFREAYDAIQRGDPGPMTRLFSDDAETLALGSDPVERRQGPAEIAAMLQEYAASREHMPAVRVENITAHRQGDMAWAVAHLAMQRPSDSVPWRETMVLRREEGDWRIIQFTVALLVPNDRVEAAWPLPG
jgi:uncharacterized protein (TIGR02246 family)